MIYDLENTLQREQFRKRCDSLCEKAHGIVELKEKAQRSLSQNNYLHLAISYFALQIGEKGRYCKEHFFKEVCNADLFCTSKVDRFTGEITHLTRSSSELTKEEMTLAIDRFLKWAWEVAEIYIPDATKEREVREMSVEVKRNEKYL